MGERELREEGRSNDPSTGVGQPYAGKDALKLEIHGVTAEI
jgi:hypothetical protein